jgi:CubicO group peptidase (beta-lactamase class C family)
MLASLALLIALPAFAQDAPAPTLVQLGETYADSLGSDDRHAFALELEAGYFVLGSVNQITVDVVVRILDPAGEEVRELDGPARGKELFQFTTKTAGRYRFEVTPFEEETGLYEFTLGRVEPEAKTPEGKVDQLMAAYSEPHTPGGVVAVARDGELEFARAYGMANLTHDVPMSVDTRNNIGSTSKQFTAFAILLLAKQGKLSLDDDIRDHIEELPDLGETVTIRHLLTHTSGYREFLNALAMTGRRLGEGDYIDRDELIEIVQRQPELQNAPGAEWNYNNTAFGLLTVVVERSTDQPFPDWMKENVFRPLGMNNTFVRPHREFVIPHASMGYGPERRGGYRERTDLSGAMGAGGIYTTVGDLAKWMHNLQTGQYGGSHLVEQMTTRFVLADGDTTGYGLGLFVDEFRGLKRIHHGGADNAHRSHFALYPEVGVGIIVHSNYAAFGGSVPAGVTEAFLSDHLTPEEDEEGEQVFDAASYDPESFDDNVGRYELEEAPGFILTFSRRGDSLFTQATGQPEAQIYPTSDSTFELRVVEASLTFHRNDDGDVKSLTLHQNGDHPATRLEDEAWAPDVQALTAFVGRYFSEELETYYSVAIEDSALVMRNRRLEDIDLTPAKEDTFTGGFPIAQVVFSRDDDGRVTGFDASNGRTRDVRFTKQD